jgi:hypothetical protein
MSECILIKLHEISCICSRTIFLKKAMSSKFLIIRLRAILQCKYENCFKIKLCYFTGHYIMSMGRKFIQCWKFMCLAKHHSKKHFNICSYNLSNHDIKIDNRCFENVEQYRYLGMTITNRNLIQEEIKRRLNSGNACYHSVQNILFSRLLSRNIKTRIYKTI